jgi:cytochrome P450
VAACPKTRLSDLAGLVSGLIKARRRRGDASAAIADWLKRMTERYRSPNIVIDLLVRRILFVSGQNLSREILAQLPSRQSLVAGSVKRKAMSFLAPHALTIAQDDEWRTLRDYNETVLHARALFGDPKAVLAHVERAFAEPLHTMDDVRRRMGQVMLAVVFGEGNAPADLPDTIQELFAEVNLRTAVLGSRKSALRDRFRAELSRLWSGGARGATPCLLALAHDASEKVDPAFRNQDVLVDQIPHWMFTFTNSGSDLLGRTLAMITARDPCLSRVREEIGSPDAPIAAEALNNLRFLDTCIFETGRLFPPAPITTHRAEQPLSLAGVDIPAGTEILQHFPFNNRWATDDPLADHFRPERWLDPSDPVHSRAPNLFLSGARACPGRELILLVVKGAIVMLLRSGSLRARDGVLSRDPVPFTFSDQWAQF